MADCFVCYSLLNEDGKCSTCDFLPDKCRCLRVKDRNNGYNINDENFGDSVEEKVTSPDEHEIQ